MSLKYRPFAAIGFTTLLSLFVINFIGEQFAPVCISSGVLIFLASLIFKSVREKILPIYISCALMFSGLLYYSAVTVPESFKQYVGKTVAVTGVIVDNPTFENNRYYYILDINDIDGNAVDTKLKLSLPEKITADVYDTVSLNAEVYEISSENYETQLYYYSKNIFLGAYASDFEKNDIKVVGDTKHYFGKFILDIKDTIINNITNNINGEKGATVVAMLLGDKSHLSDERVETFRESGVAPIFAVSGLHLSIWVLGLYTVLKSAGLRKRLSSLISIVFTVFFMFLTGFTSSVCRSGIMMIMLLAGNLFYRKADSVNSLGLAAFILCLLNPYISVDTGFLLSFSATLGIITLVPLCDHYCFKKLPEGLFRKVFRKMLIPISVSLCASIAVLPVTVLLIGRVSVFSFLTNLILNYVASVCMVTGGFGAICAGIPWASDALFSISSFLSGLLLRFVDFICSLPFTLISTENLFWKIGALVSIAIIIFSVFNFKGKKIFQFSCIALSVNIIVFSLVSHFYYSNLTQIRILNVGNGISAVVYSEGEKLVLTGKANKYSKRYRIQESLDFYNYNKSDLLLVADKNALSDSTNYEIIRSSAFKRIVVPYSDNSLKSQITDEVVCAEPKVHIDVFDDDVIRYNVCESYSLALCNFNGVSILFLFDSFKRAEIPEEYLDADYLICDGFIPYCISPERYSKVIVCGEKSSSDPVVEYVESNGGSAQSVFDYEAVLINIREDSQKIILLED